MLLLSLVDAVVSVFSFPQAHSSTSVGNARAANGLGQSIGPDFIGAKHPSFNLFKGAAGSSRWCVPRRRCVRGKSLRFGKLNIVEKHGGLEEGHKRMMLTEMKRW
jgi:hypothetical protein